MQTQERHYFPGGTGEVSTAGNVSVGLQAALLELRARLSPSLLAPAAALSVLEFSGNLFLLPILVSLSSATTLLQPGSLPQRVPSPNHKCVWRHYGNRLLWQEAEFAIGSAAVVGFVPRE